MHVKEGKAIKVPVMGQLMFLVLPQFYMFYPTFKGGEYFTPKGGECK